MVRSYEVHYGDYDTPWVLRMYEGDELLDVVYFDFHNDAVQAGEKFLDGHYVSLKVCA